MADVAALLATALAVIAALPQLRRVLVHGDGRGVSLTSPVLGVGTELAWVGYTSSAGLWTALPEAMLMVVSNSVLALALVRWGAAGRAAAVAGAAWLAALGSVAVVGGSGALAVALAGAYALQVAPSVWTVWRTRRPTGVAPATWAMLGVEGLLWGVYGLHHADPALTWFAVIAVTASVATLVRKAVVLRQGAATAPGAGPLDESSGLDSLLPCGFAGRAPASAVGVSD